MGELVHIFMVDGLVPGHEYYGKNSGSQSKGQDPLGGFSASFQEGYKKQGTTILKSGIGHQHHEMGAPKPLSWE